MQRTDDASDETGAAFDVTLRMVVFGGRWQLRVGNAEGWWQPAVSCSQPFDAAVPSYNFDNNAGTISTNKIFTIVIPGKIVA